MKKILPSIFAALFLVSCTPPYNNYYKLDSDYLVRRQQETMRFETNDEAAILSASAQVLQDLGFTIEESETKLGLITASKDRTAGSTGMVVFMTLFGGRDATWDTDQKIFTTLVSAKSRESKGYNVRIEFARIVWNNKGQSRIETIHDADIYREFFDKLSQSLFLTANAI